MGFPQLFLDGAHVANGLQVTSVMGTTIGPTTYLLNFTDFGIQVRGFSAHPHPAVFDSRCLSLYSTDFVSRGAQVIGGHEVMITETWLGETNFDFVFNQSTGLVPRATAIDIGSNDHYILNSIVFSSLIGLKVGGVRNFRHSPSALKGCPDRQHAQEALPA